MRSEIVTAAVIVAAAVIGVRVLDARHPRPAAETAGPALAASLTPARGADPEIVRIAAAADRQYYIDADVNRSTARFLVDTGASFVALRDSDARAAGVYTSYADYTYPVHTANGETKAAYVTLEEIEIGDIRIEGVKAFVLRDDQLSINLLGMSFLSRLESVEARQGELLLKG